MSEAANILDTRSNGQDYGFDTRHFKAVAALAYKQFGLNMPDSKESLVYSRLVKRLRALGLQSFDDYIDLITGSAGDEERKQLLSALTTNVSHFLREPHHFEILIKSIFPSLIARAKSGGRVRIWSAGCSTGQEPYSLAFNILDHCPEAANLDFKLLATDIDPDVLRKAKDGIYSSDIVKGLPENMRSKYMNDLGGGHYEVVESAKKLISFAELNLIADWPVRGTFDLIMCRNVAIYFDKRTQEKLWKRFYKQLSDEGCLFIGHSERLSNEIASNMKNIGVTAFQKHSGDNPKQSGILE